MIFKRDDLLNNDWYDVVEDTIIDHTRWSVIHRCIFRYEGKLYKTTYSYGATEYQDETPYEYDGEDIECPEVEAVEVTTTVYREVPNDS